MPIEYVGLDGAHLAAFRADQRDFVLGLVDGDHGVGEARAVGFDAVKHLVLAKIERRAPRLDLSAYPFLPQATVGITDVRDYLALLQAQVSQGRVEVSP